MVKGSHAVAAAFMSFASLIASADRAASEIIYAISVSGSGAGDLVTFDTASPTAITTVGPITGIVAGQTLRAIDFRPSNGLLYAMSTNDTAATLYTINLGTATATIVGGAIDLTGNTSTRVSMDFNPVSDVLRVVTGTGQSYRIDPNSGVVIAQDTSILRENATTPLIAGIAYSNNVHGAATTTLYGYDFVDDTLGTIGGVNGVPSPNDGTFFTIGNSGITSFNAALGFDISGATGIGYVSVDDFDSTGFEAELFTIDLSTGALTQISPNDFAAVLDISVLPSAGPTDVPAPASLALLAAGIGAMAVRRRGPRAVA